VKLGEEVKGSLFVVVGVERQFQQRQREREQRGQQQLRPRGASLKMIMSCVTYEDVYRAYLDCRQHKRNTPDALLFELQAEEQVAQLQRELTERTFRPSTSSCFVTQHPKLREIFAAAFRDRITHHLLVRYLEQIWEPVFIYDSYASRPGKGIHLARQRLQTFARQVMCNCTRPAYYLQLDIKNFFMSINKHILFALIRERCQQEEMLWLAETLIFHDPTEDYHLKSSRALLNRIPRQKSLFGVERHYGLPIGNLTSQFFANIYLNGLDQFVKHGLKCRFYLRYVDDFVLLHAHQAQLRDWQQEIERFVQTELELRLNPARTRLQPVNNGIDFVGYIVRPAYVLCRKRVVHNLDARLREFERRLIARQTHFVVIHYDRAILDNLFACLNSYLAHFKHANTVTLIRHIFERYAYLHHYVRYACGQLMRWYAAPKGFANLRSQYAYFQRRCAPALLFFQVGRFYEFYGAQAHRACRLLTLSLIDGKHGFKQRCGIGVHALARYVDLTLQQGVPVAVVQQTGYLRPHVAERQVAVRYGLATSAA